MMQATSWPGGVALAVLLVSAEPAPNHTGDDERKATALTRAKELMAARQWKAAIDALERYRSKHARGKEERKHVDALLKTSRGELAFETIQEKYRRTSRGRAAAAQLAAFLRKYGEDSDLRERAEELAEEARSTYARSLVDFETDDWPGGVASGDLAPVREAGLVRHGKQAALWSAGTQQSSFTVAPNITDWRAYDTLRFWIFVARKPKPPGSVRIAFTKELPNDGNPFTPRKRQEPCEYFFSVDFQGWKEIAIPLRSRRWGKSSRRGKLDFTQIEQIQLTLTAWRRTTIEVVLDDLRLEKPEP